MGRRSGRWWTQRGGGEVRNTSDLRSTLSEEVRSGCGTAGGGQLVGATKAGLHFNSSDAEQYNVSFQWDIT